MSSVKTAHSPFVKSPDKQSFRRLLFLPVALFLFLAGCGGGGGGGGGGNPPPPPTDLSITGTVQKGLFTTLAVTASVVNEQNGEVGSPIDATITDQTFSVTVDTNSLILLRATGEFRHDITGETVVLDQPLQTLIDVSTTDAAANINVATHLAASMTLAQLVAAPQDATPLLAANQTFVNDALNFGAGTSPQSLSFDNITENSDITDPNLLLLLFSASLANSLDSDSLFGGGFQIITDGFVDAQELGDVGIVLDQFTGINAQALYDTVRTNGFSTDASSSSQNTQGKAQTSASIPLLPPLILPTFIYVCNTSGVCTWVEVQDATVYIGGKALYEASGITRFPVRLSEAAADTVDVRVFSGDITAEQYLDYVGVDRTVSFAPGVTEIWVNFHVIIDAVVEPRERAQVSIESLSPGYLVSDPSSTILIQDGGPSGLIDQDATDLVILEACIKSIRVAGGLSQPGCGLLPGPARPVGLDPSAQAEVQVDLAATCTSSTDCVPQTLNWLVHFYLVSTAGTELYLGPYTYTRDSVQLLSETAKPRRLWVSFGTPEIAAFLRLASDFGESVRFEARVDAPQSVVAGVNLPELIPVPGTLTAGNQVVPIEFITGIVPGNGTNCPIGEFELSGDFVVGIDVLLSDTDSSATGTVCVSIEPGNGGDLVATLISGEIDLVGTVINLAPGHNLRGNGVLPVGFPASAGVGADVDANGNPTTTWPMLHIDGMPFMFEINGGVLNSTGFELSYRGARHVMNPGYSTQDPRSGSELYSNDIFYTGLANQSGTLYVNADRTVSTTINVAAGDAYTAFPKGQIQWTAFSQDIVDGEIVNNGTTSVSYGLSQSSSCRGPDCSTGTDLFYGVNTTATVIDPQGFSLGSGEIHPAIPVTPGWGADRSGNLAFLRPDDLVAPNAQLTMALPGYRFPDTTNGRVTDFLLAHIAPAGGTPGLGVHPLGSDASEDGNFYPTGLTVGPETYRDGNGQPQKGTGQDLTGKTLGINNGSDQAGLPSSIASKYVVRNGGVTGVFNVDPAGLQVPLPYFGYSFNLDRFAVRLIDNELDDYNWIDGSLTLNGDAGGSGGLDLFFSNLEMDCSARFGAANLLHESCDAADNNSNGMVDENCGHRLSAWRADTDIFSMGFNAGGASCATGNDLLTLEQQVLFKALDGPVGMTAQWSSTGELGPYTSSTQSSYRLDEGDEKGFPIRAASVEIKIEDVLGEDDDRYGYAVLPETVVGVPFWNAINSDVRVANTFNFGSPQAEPTVMAAANKLETLPFPPSNNEVLQQSIIGDKNLDISARYEWGNTNFGFQLPVYYSLEKITGERPQFIGRRKEADLFVLKAGAGINFIDPERTKLSFGASADIAKLKSLNLQLDLADPDNLRKVDNLLVKLKIIKQPVLEPTLQKLLDNLSVVNRLANKGLDEIMQQGLELALEELGEAAALVSPFGEDPFVTLSKALSQVKSYPQQVLTILDDEIKGSVDRALKDQRGSLALLLADFETEVSSLSTTVDTPQSVKETVKSTIDLFKSVHATADSAKDTITNSVTDVTRLIEQAQDPISKAQTALLSLDQIILQAVTFSKSACDARDLSGSEASGYLDQIVIRIDSVQKVFDFVNNDDLLLPLTELLNNDPELRTRIEQTRRDIQTQAEELAGYLNEAEQAIHFLACNDRYTELLAKARKLITDTQFEVTQIDGFLNLAIGKLNIATEIQTEIKNKVLQPISKIITALEELEVKIALRPTVGGAQLIADLETRLADMTDQRVNKILADPASTTEKDILGLVFDTAQSVIDTKYGQLRGALEEEVTDKLAGAYYSPEQLRRMFVSIIMDSQPVADLRTLMNTYFSEINYRVNNLVLLLTDQINTGIRGALAGVESEINDALEAAFAPVRNIPLESAGLDGYAVIAGNDLERAHIGAEWTMSPSSEGEEGNTFGAALDAVSWSASNKEAGCSIGADDGRLDVTISAMGIPAKFLGSDITIKKVYLGFTLGSGNGRLEPRGVFGGIGTSGDIGFSEAIIYDPAFAAGIGDIETYVGASAGALFSDIQAEVAFLVGRTCNTDILTELDPRIAEFITLPSIGFKGVYLRGGASIPLLTFGCPLTVGLGADFGAWVLGGPPTTFGGLVGGGAYGKVACAGALRGQILAIGQINTDGELFFAGEGFGAAGLGWCEPATWTSTRRVRDDTFCGTGDVKFNASFDNGKWKIPKPKIHAID